MDEDKFNMAVCQFLKVVGGRRTGGPTSGRRFLGRQRLQLASMKGRRPLNRHRGTSIADRPASSEYFSRCP